jgi:hypothetical protein
LASTGADATADVFEATISLTVPSNLKRRSSKRAVGVLGLAILEEEGQRLARAMPKIQCSEDAGTLLLGRGYRDGCCRLRPGRLVTFCWARLPRMSWAGRSRRARAAATVARGQRSPTSRATGAAAARP